MNKTKNVLFYNYDKNTNDSLFKENDLNIGDDLLLPLKKTRESLLVKNINCFTSDEINFDNIDLFVIIDFPEHNLNLVKKAKSYKIPVVLVHFESHVIISDPLFKFEVRNLFDYVLSWYTPYRTIYNKNFRQIHFTFPTERVVCNTNYSKRIINISSNKFSIHNDELYTLKRRWIFEFNEYFPDSFDLYGYGWGKYVFEGHSDVINLFNRINFRFKLFSQRLKVYKGVIERKRDIFSNYTFSLIIENVSQPYWVTEKIFDSFINGVIPIYLGCKNITDYIPSNCFISLNNFHNIDDLMIHLDNLSIQDIILFRKNISEYLNSENAKPFTNDFFVKTLSEVIVQALK
jgi:hypothetical protein